jgi:multiple sugar transport system substrate-binding protein
VAPHRKRRGVLTAVATLCALALTACSTGTPSSNGSSGGDSSGSGTVTVWHYFTDKKQISMLDQFKKMFEDSHPGTTVDNVYVPYDQINQKAVNAATSKTGPDIISMNGAEAATLILGGALAPLDDRLGAWKDKAQLPESTLHVLDGKTYALQGYVNLLALWYNEDMLNELGLKPPTTIDEMESAMAAAKAKGHSGITLTGLPNSQSEWQSHPWLTGEGFTYDNLDEAALTKVLTRVHKWAQEGWLSPEATTWDQTVPFQVWAAGDTLFAENGNWRMGTAKSDAKFKYGVTTLPVGSKGRVYLGGEAQGVGAFSKNPDLAWEYLTSTYLSPEGELAAAKTVGSLPARLDTASDSSIASDPLLVPFAQSVAKLGDPYPSSSIPPTAVNDVFVAMGQAWSSAISGQTSPEDAAATALATVKEAIGKK